MRFIGGRVQEEGGRGGGTSENGRFTAEKNRQSEKPLRNPLLQGAAIEKKETVSNPLFCRSLRLIATLCENLRNTEKLRDRASNRPWFIGTFQHFTALSTVFSTSSRPKGRLSSFRTSPLWLSLPSGLDDRRQPPLLQHFCNHLIRLYLTITLKIFS
jgi:hypothetical protein